MKLPVLVEPVAGNGYVARVGPPFNWTAEGASAEEAVAKLQREADRHLANGTRVAAIDVPDAGENPWLKWIGSWDMNDPLTREMYEAWQQGIEEYRRQRDEEEEHTDEPQGQ